MGCSMKTLALFFSVVFALFSSFALADGLQDATSAYQSGNYAEAIKLFSPLADQGNVRAQYYLGQMYEKGQGVKFSLENARKWYRLAADQGDVESQYIVGAMYENGFGVTENYLEAIKWYRLAADKGKASAQLSLGVIYLLGRGVDVDYQEAMKWFRLASTNGDVTANKWIWSMYEKGNGVDKNYQEAIQWYRLAADRGDAEAQYHLGSLYAMSDKAIQNFSKSYLWCSLAILKGNEGGVQCRDNAAKSMTPDQISQVDQLVSDCQKADFKNCVTTISVVETITCGQYLGIHNERARGVLFGKPVQTYKRDDLVAMQGQVQNCSASTMDEQAKIMVASVRLRELVDEYDSNVRQAAENERLKIEEEKRQALVADLKSGRRQPENFSELMIVTGAVDGMSLASAPKIKPDNKLYAMVGVIDSAGDKPEFLASNGVEGLRKLGYRNTEHTYFRVKIPKAMQSRYYDTAKIGVWFRLIGRYVANGSYSTVAGQRKSMPVFEATYWQPADVIGEALAESVFKAMR